MTTEKHALVTGGAGFIGSHLADSLIADGWKVTVVDNFDPFYAPDVKMRNIANHSGNPRHRLVVCDIRDAAALRALPSCDYGVVVHLAAKAGVRPSLENPGLYQSVNVIGTQNMLEWARERNVPQFVFASSSSVYGVSPDVPWRESEAGLQPVSPYAASKVAGELMGHVYAHLYGLRFIGLRFFTVYGPRQRPDLAIHKFADAILNARSIPMYGDGSTRRDYTYVKDIVGGIRAAMVYARSPYEIVNLGNNKPVQLLELIRLLEEALGEKARIEYLPEQPGDVPQTYADISRARELFGYEPATSLPAGLAQFAEWLSMKAAYAA